MKEQHNDFAGCFLKFGEYEHLENLFLKGLLYCNPISYFTKIEDQFLRGDDMENITSMHYMDGGEVVIYNHGEEPTEDSIRMPFRDMHMTSRITEPFGNLFCLYAINLLNKPFGELFSISPRVKEFGGYFVIITDTRAFLKRVNTALNLKGFKEFSANMVEYKDFSRFTGKKTVFEKDIKFAYQQEWRLFIANTLDQPLLIEIGSLEDIALFGPSENIDALLVKGEKKADETIAILTNIFK
jgi:hypothetical protein